MDASRLAVWLASYRLSLKDALHAASRDGFRLLQADAGAPEFDPRDFGDSARRHFARFLTGLGTQLAALGLEWPDLGLADASAGQRRLEQFRRTLDLCRALGVPRTGVTIAGFEHAEAAPLAREALALVGDLADRSGITVAVHSGRDAPAAAAEAVRSLGCPHVGLGVDTATLSDPLEKLGPHANLVGLAHLRDVRHRGDEIEEAPFGQGEVDFPAWLALLEAGGYAGPLVVRCNSPACGIDALRQGRDYIGSLVGRPVRR